MWRIPSEYVDINYHPYNQWYGKLWHSGFHTIDILAYFLKHTAPKDKMPDTIEAFVSSVHQKDVMTQLNYSDYIDIFGDEFLRFNHYTEKELQKRVSTYWDIDISAVVNFKKSDSILSLISINLWHNGFSQRWWLNSLGRDLYKWNGRVRHEFHMFEQWPFQAIFIESFQSKEIGKEADIMSPYDIGWEMNFTIHIFRNSVLFPDWNNYECITAKDLYQSLWTGYSKGHNEEARREWIRMFFENITNKSPKEKSLSNICDYDFSIRLFTSLYKSVGLRRVWKTPIVVTPL